MKTKTSITGAVASIEQKTVASSEQRTVASGEQKTEALSTFKEAIRKVAVVGAALAATASVSACAPFYGQYGLVGGYAGSQIVYGEGVSGYGYSEESPYYNYFGGSVGYGYNGVVPSYGYGYLGVVPGYAYSEGPIGYGDDTIPYYGGDNLEYGYGDDRMEMPGREDFGDDRR